MLSSLLVVIILRVQVSSTYLFIRFSKTVTGPLGRHTRAPAMCFFCISLSKIDKADELPAHNRKGQEYPKKNGELGVSR
jgi:hypothetical protein